MKLIPIALLAVIIGGCELVPVYGHGGKAGGGTVVICHQNKKTLELPQEAVSAHISHGDTYGPC